MTAPRVRLPLLDATALEALVRRDLAAASAAVGVALPSWFPDDNWLWTLRFGQVVAACDFALMTGKPAAIGALADIEALVDGRAGTCISTESHGVAFADR